MTKSTTSLACSNLFIEFVNQLHKTHHNMLSNWHHPLEFTFDSFLHLTEFTHTTVSQFINHQGGFLDFYPEPATSPSARENEIKARGPVNRIETKRVAVVTGGTGGIGTEICKRLFEDGHQVVATYIPAEADAAREWQQQHRQEGYEIDLIESDVTNFNVCRKTARTLQNNYGRVDILVNCAGITRDATLRKMDIDNWHAVLDTNLDSVFNVTRNVVNGMIRRGYGRIINISSVNAQKGQFGQTNYSAAKAGMIGFTRSLALELADSGITVNSICPGYVGTKMVETIPEDIKNAIIARIPVGRLANPKEVADAVSFLAAENSGYITGSEISINGGLFTGRS